MRLNSLSNTLHSLSHLIRNRIYREQEPTEPSKQPIRARYLGHVTGYQPIRDQYFLVRSFPDREKHGYPNLSFFKYSNRSSDEPRLRLRPSHSG